jgi:Steroid receptor RNA activator (SRA1)
VAAECELVTVMTDDEKREVLRQARANVARNVPREDILERRIREIEKRDDAEEPEPQLQVERNAATKPALQRSENPSDTKMLESEPEPATKEDVMDVLEAAEALCQALERQQCQIDDLERAVSLLKQQSVGELSGEIKRTLDEFGQNFSRKLDALDELLTRAAAERAKVLDLPPLPLARRVN